MSDAPESIEAMRERVDRLLSEQRDAAYHERNQLVALLAGVFPSRRTRTAIEGWEPEWFNCVYIDLPTGQASWHYHDREAAFFEHVEEGPVAWDGHTTEEKYRRVAQAALQCARTRDSEAPW